MLGFSISWGKQRGSAAPAPVPGPMGGYSERAAPARGHSRVGSGTQGLSGAGPAVREPCPGHPREPDVLMSNEGAASPPAALARGRKRGQRTGRAHPNTPAAPSSCRPGARGRIFGGRRSRWPMRFGTLRRRLGSRLAGIRHGGVLGTWRPPVSLSPLPGASALALQEPSSSRLLSRRGARHPCDHLG